MNMMRLIDRGLFVVGCGRKFPEISVPTVSEDHPRIARDILKWLKARGKTNIGLLNGLTEGRHADPFAVEISRVFSEAAAGEKLAFPESAVCQAFGLPPAAREDIVRLFFQRNKKINALICTFNPLLAIMEQLALRRELPQVDNLICVDLMSDYRPFAPSAKSHLKVAGVQNPLEDIGRHLAAQFVGKWLTPPQDLAPLPNPKITEPGSIHP
jgi:DNA-binding LacI/PurR family transcriptional regulator